MRFFRRNRAPSTSTIDTTPIQIGAGDNTSSTSNGPIWIGTPTTTGGSDRWVWDNQNIHRKTVPKPNPLDVLADLAKELFEEDGLSPSGKAAMLQILDKINELRPQEQRNYIMTGYQTMYDDTSTGQLTTYTGDTIEWKPYGSA